ncbi:hypothetical protein [Stenotrophobium rhamnosiphilum]|uniref:Uncharacterized protein n=1 Tax=Stenotrophobium rhamnosiphilum TaxID=2029166 RepID=A0A2T5MI32_9GAMM|nr:hypothetical protein [Stenotrophobium rhamnosiphilum]PTU32247.1 hypothetical protein CJD38_06210 [Stenotrophobium rhamnosiphilum]
MRIGLKSRVEKLENRRSLQSPNKVLYYRPEDATYGPADRDLEVWQTGYWTQGENPASGSLPSFTGKFLLMPDHGTNEQWELSGEKQQRDLLLLARSRK